MIYGIIYKVTCILNNKIYIGQTIKKLYERKSQIQFQKAHRYSGINNSY